MGNRDILVVHVLSVQLLAYSGASKELRSRGKRNKGNKEWAEAEKHGLSDRASGCEDEHANTTTSSLSQGSAEGRFPLGGKAYWYKATD